MQNTRLPNCHLEMQSGSECTHFNDIFKINPGVYPPYPTSHASPAIGRPTSQIDSTSLSSHCCCFGKLW